MTEDYEKEIQQMRDSWENNLILKISFFKSIFGIEVVRFRNSKIYMDPLGAKFVETPFEQNNK